MITERKQRGIKQKHHYLLGFRPNNTSHNVY